MFAELAAAGRALAGAASRFDADALTGDDAIRAVDELAVIRRLADGMIAKAAKRVADTAAHARRGDRNAASLVGRTLGVGSGEALAAIDMAAKLEQLPATEAAVRAGQLSSRQAQMIADAAAVNPAARTRLPHPAADRLRPPTKPPHA